MKRVVGRKGLISSRYGVHTPPTQRRDPPHVLPQRPQWYTLVARLAHDPLQYVCPGGHEGMQVPPEHMPPQ